ncbi:unnamed protein product [Caenorhabditis bovis]|uniref:Uncharacterized protein n=1 Tax=Caenorhabditis bovis TaxID=2654633 RepID=A0A8S1E990_9PELO|nr:unnamed protein product [Caenorhabditis bovis]
MIFINTRPVDENAQCERRASKAPSTAHVSSTNEGSSHILRLSLSLMIFYVLVSLFPCILFYPVSLISMAVPMLALFFALCSIRGDFYNTQWPIMFIAVVGILLKIAASVAYISLFPLKDNRRPGKPARSENETKHYRTVFYIILACVELFVLIVGVCLKWQLVTLQQRDQMQKRRSTLLSNRPLFSEDGTRRSIQA